ncbi:MAG: hypothetical protein EPO24_15925 [Bacteroidetes bacterium]|nr:MAG: hypothetical protein EPO24_15925 [Bacteroidota bacterium]
MWYSIEQAAALKRVNKSQIYKLIRKGKLQSQPTEEGTQVWISPSPQSPLPLGEGKGEGIQIPSVPQSKITEEVIRKVDGMMVSITASENITAAEHDVQAQFGITVSTQRNYKREFRRLYNLPGFSFLAGAISGLSNVRQALEYIVTRGERSDKATLRSGKDLFVIVPGTGEVITIEAHLKALYSNPHSNAMSCWRTLKERCIKKQVVGLDGTPATLDELPKVGTVRRFLGNWKKERVAVRYGRAPRKHDWQAEQEAFVTRDVTQYRPGELWIGDHTELDFVVINEEGKPDRRWISAFIDIRTGLLVGYHLSWQPNSQTISLAFRNGVLGAQLRAFTGEKYQPVSMNNVCETVMIDNGKDYRSNYTQRVFGKIDFNDDARKSINRITKLHYVAPYHGQSKAQMERWFGVFQTMVKNLPGYKGNRYQNQPDSLKKEIKDGEILPVETFDAYIALAVDAYNNRVKKGLKNQSPLQCYLTNQTQQRTIDQRVLDFLMVKVSNRVVRRCQVTLLGNEYYSDALMPFNGKKADIYYDPNDVGFISIYVNGEYAAVACNKELIGKTERGWLQILQDRKRGEKTMIEELQTIRAPYSTSEAKRLLLEAELFDTEAVPEALLKKNAPTVTFLTGLEQHAIRHQEELDKAKKLVEVERAVKKRKHKMAVNYNVISENF